MGGSDANMLDFSTYLTKNVLYKSIASNYWSQILERMIQKITTDRLALIFIDKLSHETKGGL